MFVETIISAVLFGALVGGAITYTVAVDPLRRSRNLLRDRVVAEQMRTYAAQSRLAAHRMLARSSGPDTFSRKAAELRSVK